MNKIFINTDGGARGNPGPAAIGVVFSDENKNLIYSYKEFIGTATNNEAEYKAILKAVEVLSKSKWIKENSGTNVEVVCRIDSQLVVEQLKGNYKVKQQHLQALVSQVHDFVNQFDVKISYVHVPREENKVADKLVNEALDEEVARKK